MGEPNIDLVLDCRDVERLAAFWSAALGYAVAGTREPYALLRPADPAHPPLLLQRVPESKSVKNRMHLDIRAADVAAKVAELEALGARRIDVGAAPDAGWVTMADPEGNEFCVCPGVPTAL